MVRVCSIYGTQMGVISIPGPLVSMASYQNIVMVAYHSGPVRKNDQCLNMKLIKFQGLTLKSENFKIALGPESTLSWLGFSNCGTPTILDSLGNLCMYKQNTWIPMCDATKQVSVYHVDSHVLILVQKFLAEKSFRYFICDCNR